MNGIPPRPALILLVEDNPADARLAQEAMADSHLVNELTWVKDGQEALNFLYARGDYEGAPRPDLVLLDLNLPRVDGREVLATIKNDPLLASIPVVILTSSESEEDVVASYAGHANCYIRKPIQLESFVSVAEQLQQFWLAVVTLPPSE